MSATSYASTADELTARILALIPSQPQILELESAWDLFRVPGFDCKDLQPSLYQASFALAKAKALYRTVGRAEQEQP